MKSKDALLIEIKNNSQTLSKLSTSAKHWHEEALKQIKNEYTTAQETINNVYKEGQEALLKSYLQQLDSCNAGLAIVSNDSGISEHNWDSKLWSEIEVNKSVGIPYLTRIGTFIAKGKYDGVRFPALLPIIGGKNVLIKSSGSCKDKARDLLKVITLRLLAALPAGKLKLICIDPVGLGSSVAGFIKGLPDSITGGKAWFTQQDIEKHLAEIEQHMAFVKQKYLGVSFSSMEEYNSKAEQIEEPYRLLVISDFPARFSDTAAQHLLSIATNGPGTGVYSIIMHDEEIKLPYGFNIEDLERTVTIIKTNAEENIWIDDDFQSCNLLMDEILPAKIFESIINKIHKNTLSLSEIQIPYSSVIPIQKEWWKSDSRAGIHIPVGEFGAHEIQYFDLNEKLLNSAIVVGKTGSGKSTLLHIIIQSIAFSYSPEEFQLFLLDFKQVEFMDYALFNLPHAKVVAVKSEREFGLSVLRGIDNELQTRKNSFGNITSLSEYRAKTKQILPRILLIADEFQELFSYDDAISSESGQILDRLIRQGRAFGVNIILSSQTLAGTNSIANSTKNQIPIRIALQCSEYDSRLILSDENDQARFLERPGEAIINSKNGRIEGNSRFQVYWLDDDERKVNLKKLKEFAQADSKYSHLKPIVFNGDSPANIENNVDLNNLIETQPWIPIKRGFAAHAWLGEPIEIKNHTEVLFKPQSRSNLLIVGQNEYEEDAAGMLLSSLMSLSTQYDFNSVEFVIANLMDVDSPWNEITDLLFQNIFQTKQIVNRRSFTKSIDSVFEKINNRISQEEENWESSIYFIIFGIHRVRELRAEDEFSQSINFDSDENKNRLSPAKKIEKILREGPEVGVHTLMWSDTYTSLTRIFQSRSFINDIGYRVVLQMGADESRNIIDSESASKLGIHRAFLFDEERNGKLEKFRPYGLPKAEWIVNQCKKMKNKK